MSDKFVYQNARVKSMESSLLTSQSVGRLLECASAQSAFKTLLDMGFGAGAAVVDGDFDSLFACEEDKAAEFLREFNVDGALDAFLAQYDFLNLKALYKASLTGKSAVPAPRGMYDRDQIKAWLDQENAADAPKRFADAIISLKRLSQDCSPRDVDCICDKAAFRYVFEDCRKKGKETLRYFVRKADYMNIGAFLRCKRLDLPKSFFVEGFIDGGELDFLPDIYDASVDVLKEKCKRTAYEDIVVEAVDGGNIAAFEKTADDALLKMWKDEKDDLFSVSPIVAFYLARITQIRVAKLAVAGIKNGVSPDKIKERMRELYA